MVELLNRKMIPMDFTTTNIRTFRKFIAACNKAGLIIWTRTNRQRFIARPDRTKDTDRLKLLAIEIGMEY